MDIDHFSDKHRWQNLFPGLYDGALCSIVHLMLLSGLILLSQTYCDMVVAFLCFSFLKDDLWPLYLALKSVVLPMYVLVSSLVVIVAL